MARSTWCEIKGAARYLDAIVAKRRFIPSREVLGSRREAAQLRVNRNQVEADRSLRAALAEPAAGPLGGGGSATGAHRRPGLLHLPTHASWLNQIEIYVSILARKALTPCHFQSLDELQDRILGFQTEFAKTASPFDWTFTRQDLHALLDRLDQRGRLAPAA